MVFYYQKMFNIFVLEIKLKMRQFTKSILLFAILFGNMLTSFADRGKREKVKNKVTLNINTASTFKNSLCLNLKTGLKYKGFLSTTPTPTSGVMMNANIITYQKGNTVYVVTNKQKIVVPEIRQGYTGMKLIIKSKN
jgi:hypothetical protein